MLAEALKQELCMRSVSKFVAVVSFGMMTTEFTTKHGGSQTLLISVW